MSHDRSSGGKRHFGSLNFSQRSSPPESLIPILERINQIATHPAAEKLNPSEYEKKSEIKEEDKSGLIQCIEALTTQDIKILIEWKECFPVDVFVNLWNAALAITNTMPIVSEKAKPEYFRNALALLRIVLFFYTNSVDKDSSSEEKVGDFKETLKEVLGAKDRYEKSLNVPSASDTVMADIVLLELQQAIGTAKKEIGQLCCFGLSNDNYSNSKKTSTFDGAKRRRNSTQDSSLGSNPSAIPAEPASSGTTGLVENGFRKLLDNKSNADAASNEFLAGTVDNNPLSILASAACALAGQNVASNSIFPSTLSGLASPVMSRDVANGFHESSNGKARAGAVSNEFLAGQNGGFFSSSQSNCKSRRKKNLKM